MTEHRHDAHAPIVPGEHAVTVGGRTAARPQLADQSLTTTTRTMP